MWVLLGVGVVVIGFVARINPLLVIAAAAITTGLYTGHGQPLWPVQFKASRTRVSLALVGNPVVWWPCSAISITSAPS